MLSWKTLALQHKIKVNRMVDNMQVKQIDHCSLCLCLTLDTHTHIEQCHGTADQLLTMLRGSSPYMSLSVMVTMQPHISTTTGIQAARAPISTRYKKLREVPTPAATAVPVLVSSPQHCSATNDLWVEISATTSLMPESLAK